MQAAERIRIVRITDNLVDSTVFAPPDMLSLGSQLLCTAFARPQHQAGVRVLRDDPDCYIKQYLPAPAQLLLQVCWRCALLHRARQP
jgi:hypothetical protein